MSNKKQPDQQRQPQAEEEKILSLDEIKEMTVGQVVRKQQDIKDGVEEDDNILDRYIKQHREDIEAEKFETLANAPAISDEMLEETRVALQPAEMAQITAATEEQANADADLQIHKVQTSEPVEVDDVPPIAPMTDFEDEYEDALSDSEKSGKKKMLIWLGLTASFVAILATAFLWMNNMNGGGQTKSSSSSSKTSSSSSTDANVAAFEKLYASFFTDGSQTKLKNSEFDKLDQLKAALDKIGTSKSGYKAAKAKYDVLEKAINAIKDINSKFDKPAIVDGELDTTANVKSGASFKTVSTGLSTLDALLASAIKMGQTQKPASSASQAQGQSQNQGQAQGQGQSGGNATSPSDTGQAATPTPTPTTPVETPGASAPASNPGWVNVAGVVYGMEIPANVKLQRELSRVPYNQAAIDDVNNEAWVFNPGILEKIIAIAKERGHISGNDYYLEKVNIINGRGYYNLFKSDGTYLFSINCKTGYFVGNAPGRADAVDF